MFARMTDGVVMRAAGSWRPSPDSEALISRYQGAPNRRFAAELRASSDASDPEELVGLAERSAVTSPVLVNRLRTWLTVDGSRGTLTPDETQHLRRTERAHQSD